MRTLSRLCVDQARVVKKNAGFAVLSFQCVLALPFELLNYTFIIHIHSKELTNNDKSF